MLTTAQDKKTEPIELTARDGNGKLPLLPNYPTETLWRIEEKIKHFLDNHDGDDEDQMVRISQAWLTVLQNLDLDANAAYRSLPNVPGPHSKDEDVKGHGAWAYGSRTRNAKSLEDKHLISDRTEGVTHSYILPGLRHQKDPNKETTAPGPSTIADSAANPRINKQGPIGLANEATTAQDLTGPLDSIAPTVVDPDQQEASALAPRVAKPGEKYNAMISDVY